MDQSFSKKINPVRFLLGACSLVNLVTIYIYGRSFLEIDGPLPRTVALGLRNNTFLNLIPEWLAFILPYWCGAIIELTLLLHSLLLIFFVFKFHAKISTLLLFIFEYSLVVRMGMMVHGGHLFFLMILFFYILEEYLPDSQKWKASGLWVIQFSLVYFFSGYYKNFDLWFFNGQALQNFIYLESSNLGVDPIRLNIHLGTWLSRIVLLIELFCPVGILYYFFRKEFNPRIPLILVSLLAIIHIGSFFFFSIFTFPIIGIAIVWGIYQGLLGCRGKPWRQKVILLVIIAPLHLMPLAKIDFFPINLILLWNKWTFFSQIPPRVEAGKITLSAIRQKTVLHTMNFNESFHWTRYRFMIDEAHPHKAKMRLTLDKYLCRNFSADEILWETPRGKESHACTTRN